MFPAACYPHGCQQSAPFVGALDAFEAALTTVISPSYRLLTSYTGPLVRVARSTDGVESDIGYDSNGALDLTALATFLGGATALVRYGYDQKGSNNLGQATTAKQPTLNTSVSQWGGMPAMVFSGSNVMAFGSGITPLGFILGGHSTGSTGFGLFSANSTTAYSAFYELGTSNASGRFGSSAGAVTAIFANPALAHQFELWYNAGSSIIHLDTTEQASVADTPMGGINSIGALDPASVGYPIIGSIPYVIALNSFYDTTNRSNLRAALNTIFPFAT